MPFKSEKQRKYLWANEPAIARDWTDKYGSRVKKANGGIGEYLPEWAKTGYENFMARDKTQTLSQLIRALTGQPTFMGVDKAKYMKDGIMDIYSGTADKGLK